MPRLNKDLWEDMRNEFVRTGCTVATLERKYNVSRQVIKRRFDKENWQDERDAYKRNLRDAQDKIMIDEDAKRITRRMQVLDLFLEKIETALDHYDAENDNSSIKQLTSAMKDVLDMQATTAGRATQQIEVVFSAGEDAWNE